MHEWRQWLVCKHTASTRTVPGAVYSTEHTAADTTEKAPALGGQDSSGDTSNEHEQQTLDNVLGAGVRSGGRVLCHVTWRVRSGQTSLSRD